MNKIFNVIINIELQNTYVIVYEKNDHSPPMYILARFMTVAY